MTLAPVANTTTRVQRRAFLKSTYFRMPRADAPDARLRYVVDDFDAGKLSGMLHWPG